MNFLAHAYLSFNNDELLVGNMISDFVKGRKQYDYPLGILKGIRLHRAIDAYTDEHQATKQAKQFFKSSVGTYSGAFVDVAYDHFLANDENYFTESSLKSFTQKTYETLSEYQNILPEKFLGMLPYMKAQDWLFSYRLMAGTQQSFGGVVRRAKYLSSSSEAFKAFEVNYVPLQKCYSEFFTELKQFAAQHLLTLNQS